MDMIGRTVFETIPLMYIDEGGIDALMPGVHLDLLDGGSGLHGKGTSGMPQGMGTDIFMESGSTGRTFDHFINGGRGEARAPTPVAQ